MEPPLYWEDVEEGQGLAPLVKRPTIQQLVRYAGASGDFYQVHYDKEFALAQGLPGVIVHGALKSAFLGQLLTDWMGQHGTLKRLSVQYRGMDLPGDTLTCAGKITRKYVEGGMHYVQCSLTLVNSQGERTTAGTATIALPSRLHPLGV